MLAIFFYILNTRWSFHMVYCFSINHVLHKTICMCSGIIMLQYKRISNGCCVRYNMKTQFLVCITFVCQSTIPNDMLIRTSTYAYSTLSPMLIPPYTMKPPRQYWDLLQMNVGLFRSSLSLHTKTRWVSDPYRIGTCL